MTAQYPEALWAPSPNYSRGRREPVRLIVITSRMASRALTAAWRAFSRQDEGGASLCRGSRRERLCSS